MITETRRHTPLIGLLTTLALLGSGCDGCSGGSGNGDGGADGAAPDGGGDGATPDGGGADTSTPPMDGALPDGALPDAEIPDGAVVLPDGGGVCFPAECQGMLRACGNCLDDDGDGLFDSDDPNCLGPCDNNETSLFTGIPGGDTPQCGLDCYYDTDQGSGNDKCTWDGRCDPLEPDSDCMYSDPPPPSAQCPAEQSPDCIDNCRPLTPNGCDCFGCCELPGGSGNFLFVGTLDADGDPTCTLEAAVAGDTDACHPCTPVEGECFNSCGRCELCLGRGPEDLPPECFPPPPPVDGGVPMDSGTPPPDSGTPVDSGIPPGEQCPGGEQPCGLPGQGPCPAGFFCLTGCCIFFG